MLREQGAEVRRFALDEASEAARSGAARLVVAGGDGSIGPAAMAAGRAGIPLAVVPVGTANDFARAVGVPLDAAAACRLAARGTETRHLELAWIGSRPFVNVASAGLASAAARRAQPFKPFLGPLAYPLGALQAAVTEDPLHCTVCAGGEEVFDGDAWQTIVAVTGAFGGGSDIDAADPEDGVLDVTVLPAGSRLGLVRRAWGLRNGSIAEQRDVCHARGTVIEVGLAGGDGFEFNVDGEVRDQGMERITVEHHAYELVVG
jgi:diacylglycerol kinase family enzyme